MGVLRVAVGPLCVAAMVLVSPNAAGQVTGLSIESFPCPHDGSLIVNQMRIDFTGSLGAQQLFMELDSGSVYQHPSGTDGPPDLALIGITPELECDSFVAPQDGLVFGGAVNLGGPTAAVFGPDEISIAWAPGVGVDIVDGSDFLVAQITLTDDAQGRWSFFSAVNGDPSPLLLLDLVVTNGRMAIPEPAISMLLAVGVTLLPRLR